MRVWTHGKREGSLSRFETSLSTRLQSESSELGRWIIRLRLASYLARRGDLSAARAIVSDARVEFESSSSAQVFAYINFAEAICDFIESGVRTALVKLQRSRVLCAGCVVRDELPMLVSAWFANFYRILGKWDEVGDEVRSVLGRSEVASAESLCRVSLVLADSFQEVENYTMANHWYKRAREHALKCGDDAALGALLYNKAAIRVFNSRIREASGMGVESDGCQVDIEAASAENYTQYIRDVAMPWVFDLLNGQLQLLRCDYEGALALLDSPRVQELREDWPAVDMLRRADVLRCRSKSTSIDHAAIRRDAMDIASSFSEGVGWGDIAAASYSLAVACEGLDNEVYEMCVDKLSEALTKFNIERTRESNMLAQFVVDGN